MGSQGYPIQAYTRTSDGSSVFQILDDGSLVLINGTQIITTDGDPNGILTAPLGSLAVDFTSPDLWQNLDDGTTWQSIANPTPPPPSGVTSFKGRTGAVIPVQDDYAIANLTLGEGINTQQIFDTVVSTILIQALAPILAEIVIQGNPGVVSLIGGPAAAFSVGSGVCQVSQGAFVIGNALTPSSATTPGVTGQIAWDDNNIYVCTVGGDAGAATWKAAALTLVS